MRNRYSLHRPAVALLAVAILCVACTGNPARDRLASYETEIRAAERAFAEMAAQRGIKEAFLAFAADDAVLNRSERLIQGRQAMTEYFDAQTLRDVHLDWAPDFVSVSASGDLGYTYGRYTFSAVNAEGEKIEAEGIFHTVWRRQADGQWRFVWD